MGAAKKQKNKRIRDYLVALMKARGWDPSNRIDALMAFDELQDFLGYNVADWSIGEANRFFKGLEPGRHARQLREVFLLVCQLTTVPSLGRPARNTPDRPKTKEEPDKEKPDKEEHMPPEVTAAPVPDPNQTGNPWLRKRGDSTREVTPARAAAALKAEVLKRDPTRTQRVPQDIAKAIVAASNDDVATQRVPRWANPAARKGIQVSDVGDSAMLIDWTGEVCDELLHETLDRAVKLADRRRARYLLIDMSHAASVAEQDQIWLVGWIARLDEIEIREVIIIRPEDSRVRDQLGRIVRAVARCHQRLDDELGCKVTEVDNKHQGMKLLQLHEGRQSPPLGVEKPR